MDSFLVANCPERGPRAPSFDCIISRKVYIWMYVQHFQTLERAKPSNVCTYSATASKFRSPLHGRESFLLSRNALRHLSNPFALSLSRTTIPLTNLLTASRLARSLLSVHPASSPTTTSRVQASSLPSLSTSLSPSSIFFSSSLIFRSRLSSRPGKLSKNLVGPARRDGLAVVSRVERLRDNVRVAVVRLLMS